MKNTMYLDYASKEKQITDSQIAMCALHALITIVTAYSALLIACNVIVAIN